MAETKQEFAEILSNEADRISKIEESKAKIQQQEQDGYDGFSDTKVKLIPNPNFSNAESVGTMLPVNMASEIVTNLSKYAEEGDLVEFVREKLNYATRLKVTQCFSSEQVDALVMAIRQFEQENAFILGDMAGIGKGRICAGVMRYAFQQGLTPIFITHKPYLYSDFYRDLTDIGGFGAKGKKTGNPVPFILNGGDFEESSIRDLADNIIFEPLTARKTNQICQDLKLPKEYNCVFLTYSQLSQTRKTYKQTFLEQLAPNSILVFDESHNAASAKAESKIMRSSLPLVMKCKAVLFSSATYAKNADVFGLYVVRTALRTAVPSLESITNALKVGGENVSEYIASGLAKEGQMIRRERSFGDCKKVTEYLGMRRDSLGKFTKLTEYDEQMKFYDEAIGYFKELRDFSATDLAKNAIYNAVLRAAIQSGKQPVPVGMYEAAKGGDQNEQRDFIKTHRGKWVVSYKPDSIARYKPTFRENLFLALKAKFTADKVIETLNTPVEYTNTDGTKHMAPMKPLIAIRNTGEALFRELDLREGDELNNDFSEYLTAVYNKLFSGKFRLRKVDQNIFEEISDLIDRGVITQGDKNYLVDENYKVDMGDFADGGMAITAIQQKLMGYKTSLPLSAIDYLRNRIESTQRDSIYYTDFNKITPRFGNAKDTNYVLSEATGRDSRLVFNGRKWVYTRIPKTSTTSKFLQFNNGSVDVLLLNVTASTGGSAQSSPKQGIDTRPRNMFIMQFELDINIEVQKRGRINRTGQLNSPTYTYIITKIPVELRTYLMFRKKLRKLDANTSANQTASSETADLSDSEGNVIEDIFNLYGFEVFINDFIESPDYMDYKKVFDSLKINLKTSNNYEAVEHNLEDFNKFVRELEVYPTSFQEKFFNVMNLKYAEYIATKIILGEYQLELKAKDYKASLKQSVPIQLNSGTTVFSLPMFLTDYYTLETRKPWKLDKVLEKVNELCTLPDGRTLKPQQFHEYFKAEYDSSFDTSLAEKMADFATLYKPDRVDFTSDEDFDIEMDRYNMRRFSEETREKETKRKMLDYIRHFSPLTPVYYEGCLGYFVGYKILDTKTKFKYTPGNIEFVFCFLNRYPVLRLKVSSADIKIFAIKQSSIQIFSSPLGPDAKKQIENWKPDYNKRIIRRFLSGNILSGIIEADKKQNLDEITSWELVRFTNYDGSFSTAIEMRYEKDLPATTIINQNKTPLSISCGNVNFFKYLQSIPFSTSWNMVPYWNINNSKIISGSVNTTGERGICILRKIGGQLGNLEVQIMQPYKLDKDTGKIVDITDPTQPRYNFLYNDNALLKEYSDFLTKKIQIPSKITYGLLVYDDMVNGKKVTKTRYNEYKVYIKAYAFNLNDDVQKDKARQFFKKLSAKYDLAFNFRASDEEALIVSDRPDIPAELLKKETKQRELFSKGRYEYVFTKPVKESVISQIPNLEERTDSGSYGGVILSLPMMPNMLPSYDLKPYDIPNEVLVKLTLSQLSDVDKGFFLSELQKRSDDTEAEIGYFVEDFLQGKTVSPIFFFGDLRVIDYGEVFKKFAQNKDLSKIIFEDVEEEKKPLKSKVTFDDAENFLIELIKS
jgi:hypothetical protein